MNDISLRFFKRLDEFSTLPYKCRLAKLDFDTLYSTRVESDLVMCYKILNNHVCLDADTFFTRRTVNLTRRHCAKLYKYRSLSVHDGNVFSNRVINAWTNGIHYAMLLFRHDLHSVARFKCRLHLIELHVCM